MHTVINKGDTAMCADKHARIIMQTKQIISSKICSKFEQIKADTAAESIINHTTSSYFHPFF